MAAQQARKFTDKEAQRFAALMAGFDTGNPCEDEAMSKGRALRRMVAEKGLRLVDAWELPEIRAAIDRQLEPERATVTVVKEVEIVNEGCRCEPWPLQMFWCFAGAAAWIVTGIFWTLKQAGRVVVMILIYCAIRNAWRKVCRNG